MRKTTAFRAASAGRDQQIKANLCFRSFSLVCGRVKVRKCIHTLKGKTKRVSWPLTSSNRRLESGGDRRPLVFGILGALFIVLVVVLLTSGDDHPCIAVQELCEEEMSEGVKSKRDTICMGIFLKLHTVWDLEDSNSAKKCESWQEMVESADDSDVPGMDKWKDSLNEAKKDLGVDTVTDNAEAIIIGATTGEWFNDDNGGRRLELQGTLRASAQFGDLKKVHCTATLTIHFSGDRNPRVKKVILGVREFMPPGSQIQIASQEAAIVGADERQLVKKIAIILEARALDGSDRKVKTQLVEPNVDSQEETRRFPIGGHHSFQVSD
jgi:hypothetical protein